MYVSESVHKPEVSFAETCFILAVCEDLRKLYRLEDRQVRFEAGSVKRFPVLFIQIRQDLVRASFFSLILFRICFIFFIVSFDHVTSYFVFSCDDFDRLLCAQGKVCHL